MLYNFWSKLYFYLKFLEDVYFTIENMYQMFSYWHTLFVCLFFFLTDSVAVAAWSGIQRVDHRWSILSFFYNLVRRSQFSPKQYLLSLGSWKKKIHILGIHPKKIIISSTAIWDELGVTWQTIGRVFLAISGASNFLNILNSFSWPFLDLAC